MPKKLLRISEFSTLSGISRKLLIFYDNNEILHPQIIDKKNGYRYYSYRQIDTANVIVSLREAGMSLENIREYLKGKSPEKLIKILENQEKTLEQQISKLSHIKGMIRTRIKQTKKGIKKTAGNIRLEWQDAENLFTGPILPDNYDLTDGWTYLPDFYAACKKENIQLGYAVGTMVDKKNLLKSLWSKPSYYFYRLPNNEYPTFAIKPKGQYVVATDYADYGQVDAIYKKLLNYIKKNSLKICGNAYEEYLIDEISEENPECYLVQIAIMVSAL